MTQFRGSFTKIKELSDKRRLPRLGKIRLGVKGVSAKTGKEYPREVEHFVVPPEVAKVFGEKPTVLDVMIPLNDIESVFPQAYKHYGGSKGLKCIGNGETAMRLDEKTQTMRARECPCDLLTQGACQRRASLMVMLPKVNMGGIYQIDLGSYHSIVDVNSGLDFVQALVGRFAMVPLTLKRVPRETHHGGIKTIHYPLQITLTKADVEWVNTLRNDNSRVLAASSRLALAPPEDCNPQFDDGATVVIENDGANGGEAETAIPYALSSTPATMPVEPDVPAFPVPGETNAVDFVVQQAAPETTAPQKPEPPKRVFASESGEPPVTVQQQSAIFKLAFKHAVKEEDILVALGGMSQKVASAAIVALQRGDTALFRNRAA